MTPYVFGDGAIDALLGVDRAGTVEVCSEPLRSVSSIRDLFGIAPEVQVHVGPTPTAAAVSLDHLALLPDGSLVDRRTRAPWTSGAEVRVLTAELAVSDIVRLYVWRRRYPELGFPLSLIRRLNADVAHLAALSAEQPDVAIRLLAADLDTLVITA